MWDRIYNTIGDLMIVLIGIISAGILYVVRMVFTNNKKIELLEQEIKYRTDLLHEVREEQKQMWRDIQRLFEKD